MASRFVEVTEWEDAKLYQDAGLLVTEGMSPVYFWTQPEAWRERLGRYGYVLEEDCRAIRCSG